MNKKNLKLGIFIIALVVLITSVSYAYYQAIFKDERKENNTNLNTEFLSSNVEVKNISGVPGSFNEVDIYPGHKEVAGMEVKVSGETNSRIGVNFIYEVLENGLNDNVSIKLYKSKEKIETSSNYFNCQKQTDNIDGETRFFETCEEKNLELLIAEKTLIGGEETLELVTDTVYVEDSEETYYYYVVVEFLNKEESQNEVMNRVLKGNIKVELGVPTNKTFEESVVAYGNLGNNIAKSMLYSSYLDKTNLAYDETVDNNLRYIGASPNNYVDFNGEKWRIIGVMNNVEDVNGNKESRIKLIRDESIGEYSWDSSPSNVNNGYGVNEWSQADLMKLLNPGYESESVGGSLYWNRKNGSCYYNRNNQTTSCNFTASGLKDDSKNYIEKVLWHIGATTVQDDWKNILVRRFYEVERSNNSGKNCKVDDPCNDNVERTTTWTGFVGLIYPSDYGYATSGINGVLKQTCLNNMSLFTLDTTECINSNWLFKSGIYQWTISPLASSIYANMVHYIIGDSEIDAHYHDTGFSYAIVPSIYLKSNIKITSGNGSKENAYKLKISE